MKRKSLAIAFALFVFFVMFNEDVNSFRILNNNKEKIGYLIENGFPKEFIEMPNKIIYVEDDCINSDYPKCTVGQMSFDKNIKLATNRDNDEILKTFVHEMGHILYHFYLNENERNYYNSLWTNTTGVTKYGDTTPSEDFSEYFTIINGYKSDYGDFKQKHKDKRREEFIFKALEEYPQFDLRNITT